VVVGRCIITLGVVGWHDHGALTLMKLEPLLSQAIDNFLTLDRKLLLGRRVHRVWLSLEEQLTVYLEIWGLKHFDII
jgi:hypothetical protein